MRCQKATRIRTCCGSSYLVTDEIEKRWKIRKKERFLCWCGCTNRFAAATSIMLKVARQSCISFLTNDRETEKGRNNQLKEVCQAILKR